jgi:hypothetical protein
MTRTDEERVREFGEAYEAIVKSYRLPPVDWIKQSMAEALKAVREEERERLFANPLEVFRGNRIKMSHEAREALLQAIDITSPKN